MTKTRDEVVEIMAEAMAGLHRNAIGHDDDSYMVWLDEAQAAYDALITAGVIPQWRPIESAPIGQTVVVYCYSDCNNWSCKAHKDEEGIWHEDSFSAMIGEPRFIGGSLGSKPTHWVPCPTDRQPTTNNLPTPPQNNRGGE